MPAVQKLQMRASEQEKMIEELFKSFGEIGKKSPEDVSDSTLAANCYVC